MFALLNRHRQHLTIIALITVGAIILYLLPRPDWDIFATRKLQGTQVIGEQFPKTLIDPLGRSQTLTHAPKRIVSTILATDEMLLFLQSTPHTVSVSKLADDRSISLASGHYPQSIYRNRGDGDTESLLMLEPDLIIVASFSQANAIKQLMSSGKTLLRLRDFHSYRDIEYNLNLLAAALGQETLAAAVNRESHQIIEKVQQLVQHRKKPRVLYYSPSGSTAGLGSITDEMIDYAGGYNVVRDTGMTQYIRISQEQAIALQPEIMLMSDWGDPEGTQNLLRDPAWQAVPAVRNKKVYIVDSAISTSISPARVDGIIEAAKHFHPELQNELAAILPISRLMISQTAAASLVQERSYD